MNSMKVRNSHGVMPGSLHRQGYAELTDRILSGFYYSDIWMSEAKEKNLPAYWYSVEGSYEIAAKATEHKEGLVGSLFIEQYREHPERLQEAMSVCFAKDWRMYDFLIFPILLTTIGGII